MLALVGVYGIIAFSVAQRGREMAIRLSLGARRSGILRLVLAEGLHLALAGVAIGLIAALALVRLLRTLLFGISPTDPLTFVAVALAILAVTVLAVAGPAIRAVRTDPAVALRAE